MSIYKNSLIHLKDEEKTYDRCKQAVGIYWAHIADVPLRHMTEELCFIALDQAIAALYYIPESAKTEKFCVRAVRENKIYMSFVPNSMFFRYSNFLRVCRRWGGYYHSLMEPFDIRIKKHRFAYRYIKTILFIKN